MPALSLETNQINSYDVKNMFANSLPIDGSSSNFLFSGFDTSFCSSTTCLSEGRGKRLQGVGAGLLLKYGCFNACNKK